MRHAIHTNVEDKASLGQHGFDVGIQKATGISHPNLVCEEKKPVVNGAVYCAKLLAQRSVTINSSLNMRIQEPIGISNKLELIKSLDNIAFFIKWPALTR